MDITQLILDDHQEQRRLFSFIDQLADADTQSLEALWARLSAFLGVHAEAEEQVFYPSLLQKGEGAGGKDSAESETLDAIKDHNEIRDAIAAVEAYDVGSSGWRRAVGHANKVNSEHMDEEEREGLSDFRRTADLKVRHDLAVRFAVFEASNINGVNAVDKDPSSFVAQHARP